MRHPLGVSTVYRRYSDFRLLRDSLAERFPHFSTLPAMARFPGGFMLLVLHTVLAAAVVVFRLAQRSVGNFVVEG